MVSDQISLLQERLEDFKARLDKVEARAESTLENLNNLSTKVEKRESHVITTGVGLVVVASLFGLVSWASFGSWVSSALKQETVGQTLTSLESSRRQADDLLTKLQTQVEAPITRLGKVSACASHRFDPPYGVRENFALMIVPEVVDSAFEGNKKDDQNNSVQMFETDFKEEPGGTGWTVYVNLRILWGLTDASDKDKTFDCSSGRFGKNRSTFVVYAIAD